MSVPSYLLCNRCRRAWNGRPGPAPCDVCGEDPIVVRVDGPALSADAVLWYRLRITTERAYAIYETRMKEPLTALALAIEDKGKPPAIGSRVFYVTRPYRGRMVIVATVGRRKAA